MKVRCLILLLVISCAVQAQKADRVRPGQLYEEGSFVESPRYGFAGTIPAGYAGMLPQGTELFMLNKKDGTSGEVLLFAVPEGSLEQMKANWEKGTFLTDAIYLRAGGEITSEGDMIYGDVIGEGEHINKAYKGFIIGRCGGFGPCVTLLMITPAQYFDQVKADMLAFMKGGTFEEPSERSPYESFDWKEFLSDKVMVTYNMDEGAKRQNMIHLCANGTFQTNIKQTHWLKQQNKDYLGKKTGTWSVDGVGPETVLHLEFDKEKAAPLDFVVSIKEEKVYLYDVRYYAGYSDYCEKD